MFFLKEGSSVQTFSDLNISKEILDALNKIDITEPTDIQKLVINPLLEGKDVIGQAQTGTGKTFAYSIPMLEQIDVNNRNIQGLILCPTRELGIQVSVEVKKLIAFKKDIKITTVYGGESYEKQIKSLRERPQIVIGTPGRIIDLMNRHVLDFSHLRMLTLDEADEMLKMGFQEALETILKVTPKERQTALFSATMPPFIKQIALNYQNNPEHLIVERKTLTVERITQNLFFVKKEYKKDLLIRILDLHDFRSSIIFCNTKSMVDELVLFLQKNKYLVDGLHGDLKQMVRDRVMTAFRNNSINILVATDVAARGIDVSGIDSVINYDIPLENELYVHRIGRTGRAGCDGLSITFASPREHYKVKEIEKFTNSTMHLSAVPTVEDIQKNYLNKVSKTILSKINVDKDYTDYSYVVEKICGEGYSHIDVINALMTMACSKTEHEYKDIPVEERQTRKDSTRSRDNDNQRGKKDFKNNSNKDYKNNADSKNYRNSSKNDRNDFNNKKNMVLCEVNLGKTENLRPQSFINACHDIGGVHKEHFGAIEVKDNKTICEISTEGLRFLKQMSGKVVGGRKVSVKVISNK